MGKKRNEMGQTRAQEEASQEDTGEYEDDGGEYSSAQEEESSEADSPFERDDPLFEPYNVAMKAIYDYEPKIPMS